jgi:hypothetical protein
VNLAIFAPILRKAFWTYGSFQLAVRQSSGTSWDTIHDNRREHAIRETRTENGVERGSWEARGIVMWTMSHVHLARDEWALQEYLYGDLSVRHSVVQLMYCPWTCQKAMGPGPAFRYAKTKRLNLADFKIQYLNSKLILNMGRATCRETVLSCRG